MAAVIAAVYFGEANPGLREARMTKKNTVLASAGTHRTSRVAREEGERQKYRKRGGPPTQVYRASVSTSCMLRGTNSRTSIDRFHTKKSAGWGRWPCASEIPLPKTPKPCYLDRKKKKREIVQFRILAWSWGPPGEICHGHINWPTNRSPGRIAMQVLGCSAQNWIKESWRNDAA